MKQLLARFARMSPAMVVAMIALFVALSGTAVATTSALITGRQIKNNSITGADVKNKSLTPRDFRGSVRGPRGLRGLTGAQGPQGSQGPQGPQGDTGPPGAPNPNAVNSDKLDGLDANQLTRIAFAPRISDTFLGAPTEADIRSVVMTVPVKAYVRVSFTSNAISSGSGCPCTMQGRLRMDDGVRTIVVNTNLGNEAADLVGGFDRRAFAGSEVYLAEPGDHTFTLSLFRQNGAAASSMGVSNLTMQAVLMPFDSAGVAPAAFAGSVAAGASN